MAHLEKRRDGSATGKWMGEVDFRKSGGQRFRRTFDTLAEAEGYEAYVRKTRTDAPWATEGTSAGKTFADVAQELIDAGGPKGRWKRGKDKGREGRLAFLMAHKIGRSPVKAVDYAMVEELHKELMGRPTRRGTPRAAATLNRYTDPISSVLAYAERKKYIERAPQLPRHHEPTKKQGTYQQAQVSALISWLREHSHPIIATCVEALATTGLRVSELVGLQREQIVDDFVILDDPELIKNEECHVAYIGLDLARELRAIIVACQMPSYVLIDKWVRKGNKALGTKVSRPIHKLRSFACTAVIKQTGDLNKAKQLLGHRNIKTTERYAMIDLDMMREWAKNRSPVAGDQPSQVVVGDFRNRAK